MRVLIVGAGIGGPTLAYWLLRAGHQVTVIEQAPQLRKGGYLVDFWGAGFDVAERMGIVPELRRRGYEMRELREVDAAGRRKVSIDPHRLLAATKGRYTTVARTDLAATIMDSLEGRAELLLGDSVRHLDDRGDTVAVEFDSGGTRDFDLVVGADGLHSRVRRLVFGPPEQYEKRLGISVAAFDVDGYAPRDDLVAVSHTTVGYQALRLSLRDGATMFIVMLRDDGDAAEEGVTTQQQLIRERLGSGGWELSEIIRRMPEARTFYFDRASQILMPSWSRGRIGLVGDAAACPSLLAGQGSALAMIEAYVLAAALGRAPGDPRRAFEEYHRSLASLVRAKQDAAIGLGLAFAPRTRGQLFLRNSIMRMIGNPLVARLAIGRSLRDPITLPPPPDG